MLADSHNECMPVRRNKHKTRCLEIQESQGLQELRQNIVKYSHFAAKIRKSVRV